MNLKNDPCSCEELQAQDVPIISHNRTDDSQFKCGTALVDRGNEWLVEELNRPFLTVPTDDSTWYVVPPEKSVIFRNDKGTGGHPCWLISLYSLRWLCV